MSVDRRPGRAGPAIRRAGRRAAALSPALALLAGAAGPLRAQRADSLLLRADTPVASARAYVGNGRFTLLGSPRGTEGALSFLAGLYEHFPGDVPRIAALPAWNAVDVHDGAGWLDSTALAPGSLAGYRQLLDMGDGVLRTSYSWVHGARRTAIDVEAFVSRADPRLGVVRIALTPSASGPVRLSFPLVGWPAPQRLRLAELQRIQPDWGPARLWYPGRAVVLDAAAAPGADGGSVRLRARPVGGATVAEAAVVTCRGVPGLRSRAVRLVAGAALEVSFVATAGRTYACEKYVGIASTLDGPDPLALARRSADAARAAGYAPVREAHAAAARRLWRTDIVVEGDPELQRVVRGMLFRLRAVAGAGGWSIPPMGLSSAGYYGHVFWDADTWMLPPLLLLDPAAARAIVDFRCRTLDAARRNARANGFAGAMYPWEADDLGAETTPRFASQNASSEIHVTGDVAVGQWLYYLATGDDAWLARCGYPVLAAIADFWVSRVSADSADGRYHVRDVVSVDEGLVGVDDDAYTNAVALRALQAVDSAARRLGRRPDPRWARVASRLYIPYDSAGGYHPTYHKAAPATLGSVVPLLAYPLGLDMPVRARRTDLANAVMRMATEGAGSMMTVTLYPVVAAELGDRALLDALLRDTYRPWLRGPFDMLAETPRSVDATDFLTGAGGFLQQVVFGWTGLRLGSAGLEPRFRPVLPSSVRRLELRGIYIRGEMRDIVVEGGRLRILP
ncbi:MAG: glycoside hydrolase family 65 protein [Gemmatimonadetes bacterium]|nr:glycoside hydrolase family 65 protein [Gemmatimonadota bacterium]